MRPLELFALGLVSMTLTSCYLKYVGVYTTDAPHSQGIPLAELVDQVHEVVRPFGMRRMDIPQAHLTTFERSAKEPIGPSLSALEGNDARTVVTVCTDQFRIIVADEDNDYETAFVRELKRRIVNLLMERYRIQGLQFGRAVDVLS